MVLNNYLIPARFLATCGHFIAILMITYTKNDNVNAGVGADPSDGDINAAKDEIDIAIGIAIACFVLDFLSIFRGFSLFFPKVNFLQIFLHILGSIFISWFIQDSWDYRYLWNIIGWTSITTAIIEILILFGMFGLKIFVY